MVHLGLHCPRFCDRGRIRYLQKKQGIGRESLAAAQTFLRLGVVITMRFS